MLFMLLAVTKLWLLLPYIFRFRGGPSEPTGYGCLKLFSSGAPLKRVLLSGLRELLGVPLGESFGLGCFRFPVSELCNEYILNPKTFPNWISVRGRLGIQHDKFTVQDSLPLQGSPWMMPLDCNRLSSRMWVSGNIPSVEIKASGTKIPMQPSTCTGERWICFQL